MEKTIFLIAGQHILSDFNPTGMTPQDIMDYFFANDLKHEYGIEFAQSSTGHWTAGWGRSLWILKDGIFEYYGGKEDSSG